MSDVQVVVTGLGATTPVGHDAPSTWSSLLASESGVEAIEEDWAADVPVPLAARMRQEPAELLSRAEARRMDRCEQAALVSAREAWADAGQPAIDPDRLAVAIGTGTGGIVSLLEQDDNLERFGPRRVSPHMVTMMMPNGAAAWVSLDLSARAGALAPTTACAAGAEAVAAGLDMIRLGRADMVIAGGTDAFLAPVPMTAFAQMKVLSTRRRDDPTSACRPFDATRDGIVLGEGAALLVLERADHARSRSARPYATLAGAGITSSAHHITASEPTGQARAMRRALEDSGLRGRDIGHVNAHATSTPGDGGDLAEVAALTETIGTHAAVSAIKSMTGHLVGASGSLGALGTVLALRDGVAPPIRNLEEPDPRASLDLIRDKPRHGAWNAALSNAFGFGGHNVSLAFTRAE